MPLPAELVVRPPPRYTRHLGKLLLVMVLLVLYDTLSLVGEVEQHKRGSTPIMGAAAPVEIFEVTTRFSGEVIVCTTTRDGRGTATSAPIQVGYLYSCDASRSYTQKFRAGQAGCLAFHNAASMERFMTCFVEEL